MNGIPPIGKPAGLLNCDVTKCPLCGGRNPEVTSPTPEPVFIRTTASDEPRPVASPAAEMAAFPSLIHPTIGGRMTCFVLCWGPHTELARRCVGGILDTTPPGAIDLRVICNECCPETIAYLRSEPRISRLYINSGNRKKYPAMREAFRDPDCPITTPYLLWFDDDSYPTSRDWFEQLCNCIVANHAHGGRMYGWKHLHDYSRYIKPGNRPDLWFKHGEWFRGRAFRTKLNDRPAPNGTVIEFVTGGFWALNYDAAMECHIPDKRLLHNGGDVCIGEQVRQAGYKNVNFNEHKALVMTSGSPRRGYSEHFPWANYPATDHT